jgi:polyisoprenyl-teichoic acid--peptidoglycan teichoic acid transferase
MNKARRKRHNGILGALLFLLVALLGSGLQGCLQDEPITENRIEGSSLQTATILPQTPMTQSQQPDAAENTSGGSVIENDLHVWEDFPPPSIDPATPIPPPLRDLVIDDEVLVWILLGSDTEPPFIGSTPAVHLLFIHPRLSKASLVSIPGDLYVYIPGYTMQRLKTAYALGGIETLRVTLSYNFGVSPSRFVLAHPGDFQWLVDDIGTVNVTVFYPIPWKCGGIRAGQVPMDGALALCYATYREGIDEIDRMRRQQQLMRVIFHKLTQDGNLTLLPVLYQSYEGWVKTDLSLEEVLGYIPLALRLADEDRISTYLVGWDETEVWEVPGQGKAQVFLPKRGAIRAMLQNALDDVKVPDPFTNRVSTLEAQLTAAFQNTHQPEERMTPTPSPSPMITGTQTITMTTTTTTPSPTPTPSPPGYP